MLRFASGILGMALAAGAAHAGETVVSIANYRYDPPAVVVKAGDTVEWRNDEKRTSHDITFPDGAASERLMPGDSFRRTFATPGRYAYICEAHKERPEMKGEVVVEP